MEKKYKIRMEYLKQLRDMFENFVDDPIIARDYLRIDLLIERLEHNFQQEAQSDTIVEQLKVDYEHWPEFRRYFPRVKRFYNSGLYFNDAPKPKYKEINLCDEDTVRLTREFFSKQGDFFIKNYDEFLNDDSQEHIDFFEPSPYSAGETVYLHTTGDAFIFAANDKNIVKLTSFVHESEHVIDCMANENYFENTTIREINAMFMELIACDYFNQVFSLDKQNLLRQFEILGIVKMDSRDVIVRNRMLKLFNKSRMYDEELIYRRLKRKYNEKYMECMTDYTIYQLYNYQIPYLTAIELYSLYQVDRDKAINTVIDIILNGNPNNIFTLLSKHGISLNKHTTEYEDNLCLKLGI